MVSKIFHCLNQYWLVLGNPLLGHILGLKGQWSKYMHIAAEQEKLCNHNSHIHTLSPGGKDLVHKRERACFASAGVKIPAETRKERQKIKIILLKKSQI